jgi:hypothetical protein
VKLLCVVAALLSVVSCRPRGVMDEPRYYPGWPYDDDDSATTDDDDATQDDDDSATDDDDATPTDPCPGPRWTGDFSPESASDLSDFCTAGYTGIDGDLLVYGDGLTSLLGLNCLCAIEGSLSVGDWTPSLTSLAGLENLRLVGGDLNVEWTQTLSTVSALDGVTSVGGSVSLFGTEGLVSVNLLPSVEEVGGHVDIAWNTLVVFGGFDSLRSVGTYIRIANNSGMTTIGGFEALEDVGGDLEVADTAWGFDLATFNALQHIGGSLLVADSGVVGMPGFGALEVIDGSLAIDANPPLVSIAGLAALRTIGGNLQITGNDTLADISGLAGITRVEGNLTVQGNGSLPTADVEAIVVLIYAGEGVGGTVYVGDNG